MTSVIKIEARFTPAQYRDYEKPDGIISSGSGYFTVYESGKPEKTRGKAPFYLGSYLDRLVVQKRAKDG